MSQVNDDDNKNKDLASEIKSLFNAIDQHLQLSISQDEQFEKTISNVAQTLKESISTIEIASPKRSIHKSLSFPDQESKSNQIDLDLDNDDLQPPPLRKYKTDDKYRPSGSKSKSPSSGDDMIPDRISNHNGDLSIPDNNPAVSSDDANKKVLVMYISIN